MNALTLKQLLLDAGLANVEDVSGCSEQEVVSLETYLGLKLPLSYRAFLMQMGHAAGRLFRGTDVFYGSLFKLRGWAEELLKESKNTFHLPDDAIVILMHQGYVFLFIRTSQGDDPPVYRFVEGEESTTKLSDTFSEFLVDSINNQTKMTDHRRLFQQRHAREHGNSF